MLSLTEQSLAKDHADHRILSQTLRFADPRRRTAGIALIMALFIMALIAILAIQMTNRLANDTKRTLLLLRDMQATLLIQGSLAWAKDQLSRNQSTYQPNQSQPMDQMPLHFPEQMVENYHIKSTLYDIQARFNINALVAAPNQRAHLRRLIRLLQPSMDPQGIDQLLDALQDWMTLGLQNTAYDRYYLSQSIPYRSAHRPLVSLSELSLIKGMTPQLLGALRPYLIALPEQKTLLNIQTVPPLLLLAWQVVPSIDAAQTMVKQRVLHPFLSTNQLPAAMRDEFTTISHFFILETTISNEQQQWVRYILLKRSQQHNQIQIDSLWQTRGVL